MVEHSPQILASEEKATNTSIITEAARSCTMHIKLSRCQTLYRKSSKCQVQFFYRYHFMTVKSVPSSNVVKHSYHTGKQPAQTILIYTVLLSQC